MEHNPARFYRGPVGVVLEPVVRRLQGHGLATRHPILWKAHRAVWLTTRSNRVIIEGHDLLLDPGDACALASGRYEPGETAWYKAHVKPGDLVVEAGANLGFFSLLLARLVGAQGSVICYEPDPDLAQLLRRNVKFNGYQNVDVREAAVANVNEERTFFRSSVTTGDHRLFSHGPDDVTFPVRCVRLDDDLSDIDRRIDLLKMDIQGAEPVAIEGFAKTLAARPPRRMLLEYWPHGIVGMGQDPRAFVELLRAYDYRVEELGGGEIDLDQALARMTVENLKWVNLICTHRTAEER